MNNEDMDMLEWIVRKIVPIPKQYYWETDDTTTTITNLPRSVLVWHNVVGSLSRAVQWLDRMGTPVAHATGLSTSRFDYVLSTMTPEQKEMAAEIVRERKLKMAAASSTRTNEASYTTTTDSDAVIWMEGQGGEFA